MNFKQKYAKIRGCSRKIKHVTEESALKAKGLLETETGRMCRVYRCSFCFGYHVSCEKEQQSELEVKQ